MRASELTKEDCQKMAVAIDKFNDGSLRNAMERAHFTADEIEGVIHLIGYAEHRFGRTIERRANT